MISVVIPTQNMSSYLEPLFESFFTSGCEGLVKEVIVVNDGSQDNTGEVIKKIRERQAWGTRLKVLNNEIGQGRFRARQQGAMAASADVIWFMDTRIVLPEALGAKLQALLMEHRFLMGVTSIDTAKSIFNLYWERSHEWVYRKHYRDVAKGFLLTVDNYEQYAKGTTMLIVGREEFVKVCEEIGTVEVLADDSLLIREIVKRNPVFVTNKFSFNWEPRQTWTEFISRLLERGPSFVEYHFLAQKTRFFYASMGAICFAVLVIGLSISILNSFFAGVLLLFLLALSSVLLITRKPFEVLYLGPLHLIVIVTFSLGVVHGVYYHLLKRLSERGAR